MELPPLPSAAMRVATLAQDMNASAKQIVNVISLDPLLATRVLRAANSPLYALERRVTALPMAVSALGNQAIGFLVMVYAASDAFKNSKQQSNIERALWEHSVTVGIAAREISHVLGMRGADESFLCGLLHDIGKLLLFRSDAETYAQTFDCRDEGELLQREQELYGYTHTQIGALAARRWELPDEIAYAIYYHHQPSDAGQSSLTARIVDVADSLANKAGIGQRHEPERDLMQTESVIALHLTEEQLETIWINTVEKSQEMSQFF
jgi:putative nucleotidyltransferase with HDIG domain